MHPPGPPSPRPRPAPAPTWLCLLALLSLGSAPATAEHNALWSLHAENEDPVAGYRLFRSSAPGSSYPAYRLEATIDAPPDQVAAAAVLNITAPDSRDRMERTLLRREERVLVSYNYIHVPLIADRDVTIRTEIHHDTATGTWRLDWRNTDEEGPAPRRGVVRIERSQGFWEFVPDGRGRTRAIHETHVELGASMPVWLVDSLLADQVVQHVGDLRARVNGKH